MFDLFGLGELFKNAKSVPDVLLVELRDWLEAFQQNAPKMWIPRALQGHVCAACEHPCFLACEICKQPSCMEHAFIHADGRAFCMDCLEDAKILVVPRERRKRPRFGRARAEGGPRKNEVAEAYRILNIPVGSSFEHCKSVYRKLAFELHPDRHQNDPNATGRFKEVQKAFDTLRRHYEGAGRAHA